LIQKLTSKLEKISGKFMVRDFDVRHNFDYWNPIRFEMDFELKFRGQRVVEAFSDLFKILKYFGNL
jgi:hypothetical protein